MTSESQCGVLRRPKQSCPTRPHLLRGSGSRRPRRSAAPNPGEAMWRGSGAPRRATAKRRRHRRARRGSPGFAIRRRRIVGNDDADFLERMQLAIGDRRAMAEGPERREVHIPLQSRGGKRRALLSAARRALRSAVALTKSPASSLRTTLKRPKASRAVRRRRSDRAALYCSAYANPTRHASWSSLTSRRRHQPRYAQAQQCRCRLSRRTASYDVLQGTELGGWFNLIQRGRRPPANAQRFCHGLAPD